MPRRHEDKQIYRFAESSEPTALRKRGDRKFLAKLEYSLHMLRDSDPFIYVLDELSAVLGFRFGGILFNLPKQAYGDYEEAQAGDGILANARSDDLIVSTTRLTLPYSEEDDSRHKYGRSETKLEADICYAFARGRKEFGDPPSTFLECNRTLVHVSADVISVTGATKYTHVDFGMNRGRRKDGDKAILGYAAYVPRISNEFPYPMLNLFALNGTATLLWAYVVTTFFPGKLAEMVAANDYRLIIGKFNVKFPNRPILDLAELTYFDRGIEVDATLRA